MLSAISKSCFLDTKISNALRISQNQLTMPTNFNFGTAFFFNFFKLLKNPQIQIDSHYRSQSSRKTIKRHFFYIPIYAHHLVSTFLSIRLLLSDKNTFQTRNCTRMFFIIFTKTDSKKKIESKNTLISDCRQQKL